MPRRPKNKKSYALVAQSVEHLTFNQRAWDSSSHERTKKDTSIRMKNAAGVSFCFVWRGLGAVNPITIPLF